MTDISKELDPKMISRNEDPNGMVWFDATEAPFDLYGLYATNPFRRMPEEVAAATNAGVKRNNFHTAGGRVRFSTDSTRIGVRVSMPYVTKFVHMPMTGSSSFDVYLDTPSGSVFRSVFKPDVKIDRGFEMVAKTKGAGMRFYTLNFPLYSPVDRLEIGIDAGASIGGGARYTDIAPVVYYGSSITQGACASRPGLAYQAIISRKLNIDFVNLGFSGNALGEQPIVDYMAHIKMSAFVADYDHNAPNAAHLEKTHCNLYRTVRDANPDIPIILLSRPDFIFSPEDSCDRRAVIEDTFRYARAQGDRRVWFIDGDGICRGEEEDSCSTDGTHPNDIGFMKMADCIGRILTRALRHGTIPESGI